MCCSCSTPYSIILISYVSVCFVFSPNAAAIFTAKQNPDTGAFQFQHPDGIVGVNTADRKFGLYPYSQVSWMYMYIHIGKFDYSEY